MCLPGELGYLSANSGQWLKAAGWRGVHSLALPIAGALECRESSQAERRSGRSCPSKAPTVTPEGWVRPTVESAMLPLESASGK